MPLANYSTTIATTNSGTDGDDDNFTTFGNGREDGGGGAGYSCLCDPV